MNLVLSGAALISLMRVMSVLKVKISFSYFFFPATQCKKGLNACPSASVH